MIPEKLVALHFVSQHLYRCFERIMNITKNKAL
jgi:hypothetical protein